MEDIPHEPADIRLGQLADTTGLTPLLIRAWERRYGFPRPTRTEGGHRRYAPGDVARLHRAALLVRAGFRPREAIERALREPTGLPEVAPDMRLQEVLVDGEPTQGLAQLRGLEHALGFEAALEDVVLPTLHAIGEAWFEGRVSVAQEHGASSVIISWLGAVRAGLRPIAPGAPAVLLASAPDERHGLPPLALEVLLTRRGLAAASLDADVPAPDLVSAAALRRPAAVVLSVSRSNAALGEVVTALLAPHRTSPRTLGEARGGQVSRPPRVYVGGPGVDEPPAGAAPLPPRLTTAADFIAADLGLTTRSTT